MVKSTFKSFQMCRKQSLGFATTSAVDFPRVMAVCSCALLPGYDKMTFN